MKNRIFWWCFAGGFLVSFIPFLFPNGWIFLLGPFIGRFHIIEAVFYVPFVIAIIQGIRGKNGAYGWFLGSIVSVTTGVILYFTIGFNFVPV